MWKAVYPHVRALELAAKPFEVWINGRQSPSAEVHKELQRLVRRYPGLLSATPQTLPKGVIVRATNSSQLDFANVQLPFRAFNAYLRSDVALSGHTIQQAQAGQVSNEEDHGSLGLIASGKADRSSQLGIPGHLMNGKATCSMSPSAIPRLFSSTFYQNLMFLMSNEFVSLNAHVSERTLRFLRHDTSETLFESLRSASHFYTAQAIIFNLFRMAIEVGDSMTVRLLLGASLLRVPVNQIICYDGIMRLTAIERAALLGYRDVVKVLLDHDADVKSSFALS